jgi:salicylate hydroxylase
MTALNAIVVGGGIGGLAAAVALRRAGHTVTVLEQAGRLSEVGAAVGMGPNATAALLDLGIRDELADKVVYPRAWTRRRWQNGAVLGAYYLGDAVVQRFGHPFWMVHRARLHAALHNAAIAADRPGPAATIELNTRVTSAAAETGEVTTADGRRFRGDVIVGADGIRSRVREELFGQSEARFSGNVAIRAQIPAGQVLSDPVTRPFAADRNLETWVGPGAHIVHTLLDGGELLNITACVTAESTGSDTWFAETSTDYLLEQLTGWYEPLRRLVSAAKSVGCWDLYDRAPIPVWSAGRACLLGDAAHPMLPYLGQGAAQTLEDAVALGAAFTGTTPDGVREALRSYELRRRDRAAAVQRGSLANRDIFHLPDGPRQRERDEELRRGGGDFEVFAWLWEPQAQAAISSKGAGAK